MKAPEKDIYAIKRRKMVDDLLIARGISDKRVIATMGRIPRHMFVEPALMTRVYEDYAAPLGGGQTISKPHTVALMTQMVKLKGDETVLEIGTGSGYQAAVLSTLVERVYSVERISSLSNKAKKIFNKLHLDNIMCMVGDGTNGSKKYAPFDVIVVTAGAPEIPVPLAKQLKDGGRMVVPVGNGSEQKLHLVVRKGERFTVTKKEDCSFVPLIGEHGWKEKPSRY